MGYTNYFTTAEEVTSKETREKMAAFAKFAVDLSDVSIKGGKGTGEPSLQPWEIWLNGDEEKGEEHESFALDMMARNKREFCKTNRKPYDKVVKACLMYAKDLGIISSWSFDGDNNEEEYLVAEGLKKAAEKMTEGLTSDV
jgi:hypothetical protein